MKNNHPRFEDWIQEQFLGHIAPETIKDNFEDAFDNWVSNWDWEDTVEWAQRYGDSIEMKYVQ